MQWAEETKAVTQGNAHPGLAGDLGWAVSAAAGPRCAVTATCLSQLSEPRLSEKVTKKPRNGVFTQLGLCQGW